MTFPPRIKIFTPFKFIVNLEPNLSFYVFTFTVLMPVLKILFIFSVDVATVIFIVSKVGFPKSQVHHSNYVGEPCKITESYCFYKGIIPFFIIDAICCLSL